MDATPSELGALNAAHASPQALAHASPNSRVGRIAAYRDAVLGRAVVPSDYDLARAELDAATLTSIADCQLLPVFRLIPTSHYFAELSQKSFGTQFENVWM